MSAEVSTESSLNISRRLRLRDFRILSVVGEGNMGKVYLTRMADSTYLFAMKVVEKDPRRMHRIHRAKHEAHILSILNHPFLPSLTASFHSSSRYYILTNYCTGGDLNALRRHMPTKKFSESAARFYAAEVVVALEYLHGIGIVHRDLKPENVLIQADGHITLTDFDMCLQLQTDPANPKKSRSFGGRIKLNRLKVNCLCDSRTAIGPGRGPVNPKSFVGTQEYVAPEVLREEEHGFAMDWWSFGIFLYEMVVGRTPFKGRDCNTTFYNILKKQPKFPDEDDDDDRPVYDLIRKLLVKDPSKRLGLVNVKSHGFFSSTRWSELQNVSRTPFIPRALSFDEEI